MEEGTALVYILRDVDAHRGRVQNRKKVLFFETHKAGYGYPGVAPMSGDPA
jgi:hypothetical protein